MQIIFENQHFLVLNKPHGISFHKDDNEDGFMSLVQKELAYSIYSVHRLDKVTSGLIIFAKSKEDASKLGALFRDKKIQKTYLALAKGKPSKKQGTIKGDMAPSRRGAHKLLRSMNNPAITKFTSELVEPGLRLYRLSPITGKTHQLRVAMKSIGTPILGDKLYGGDAYERTCLHCYCLEFVYNNELMSIQLAADFVESV